jgi:hypothetical protein
MGAALWQIPLAFSQGELEDTVLACDRRLHRSARAGT